MGRQERRGSSGFGEEWIIGVRIGRHGPVGTVLEWKVAGLLWQERNDDKVNGTSRLGAIRHVQSGQVNLIKAGHTSRLYLCLIL